jgi:hypothetical protein
VLKRPQQYTRASEPPYCKENDINPSLNESMHSDGKSRGGGGKKRERSAPPKIGPRQKKRWGPALKTEFSQSRFHIRLVSDGLDECHCVGMYPTFLRHSALCRI